MDHPQLSDLAHDLRNLVGLVQSLAAELAGPFSRGLSEEARAVLCDLQAHSRYAVDALRVVERWSNPEPVEIHLGAWAWALRLKVRQITLGDLAHVERATVVVPQALEAGRSLVTAMGQGRTVHIEPTEEKTLSFEIVGSSGDRAAIDRAIEALSKAGLKATVQRTSPLKVTVSGHRPATKT